MLILTIAEIAFRVGYPYVCLALYIFNLFYFISLVVFRDVESCAGLLPIVVFRIVNLSMPVLLPYTIYWIPTVYISVVPSLFYAVRVLDFTSEDLGFTFRFWYLLPFMIVVGYVFGYLEFTFGKTSALIPSLSYTNILVLSIVMFVFVGFVEELTFRSVFQTNLEKVFCKFVGLLLASFTFGIMHENVVLAVLFGLVAGFVFQKTKNVLNVTVLHGITCIFAYGLLPMGIGLLRFST